MPGDGCDVCGDPTTDIEVRIERTPRGPVELTLRLCSHRCLCDYAAACAREDDNPVEAAIFDAVLAIVRMGTGRAWNGAPVPDGAMGTW